MAPLNHRLLCPRKEPRPIPQAIAILLKLPSREIKQKEKYQRKKKKEIPRNRKYRANKAPAPSRGIGRKIGQEGKNLVIMYSEASTRNKNSFPGLDLFLPHQKLHHPM